MLIKRLTEILLPYIIRVMVHKKEKLTAKEMNAQKRFIGILETSKRKTKDPIIVALIGLVGSGKSTVANALSKMIGATVIEGDKIRICLRKQNERYEGTRKIAENAAVEMIERGNNVIIDSDHIDPKKRASLREKAKAAGAKLLFIRTHCDYDVMVGRAITKRYPATKDDFFGGAGLKSKWKDSKTAGSVVKLREIWRRTPHHYYWKNKVGGKWIPKKLPFKIFAEIDISDNKWREKLKKSAQRIIDSF